MFDIVTAFARRWRYQINPDKSAIIVFGEAPRTRARARLSRIWVLSGSPVREVDEIHHLGFLRTTSPSTIHRTNERCTAGRSAFFALSGFILYQSFFTALNSGPLQKQNYKCLREYTARSCTQYKVSPSIALFPSYLT